MANERGLGFDLLEEIASLYRVRPRVSASAETWIAWHERHAACWEQLASDYRVTVDNATLMARKHRRDIATLRAEPDNQRARQAVSRR